MQLSKIKGMSQATTVELDFHGILNLICSDSYSGSTFHDGHRKLGNFEQTSLIILDIDDGLTLEDAESRLSGYKYIMALTRNHRKIKQTTTGNEKKATDRFRIILFLDGVIKNSDDFKHTYKQLLTLFPEADAACSEAARFFYQSTSVYSYQETGKLIDILIAPITPKKQTIAPLDSINDDLGKLSYKTKDFISNGAEPGTINQRVFDAALDLRQQNYPREAALALLRVNNEDLLNENMRTFDNAFGYDPQHPPRDGKVVNIKGFAPYEPKIIPAPTEYKGLTIPFFTNNIREWLDDLFEQNNMKLYANDEIKVNGKTMPFEQFHNIIYIATGEAKKYKYDSRGEILLDKFKKKVVVSTPAAHRGFVDSYMNTWIGEERIRILNETKEKIKFVAENDEMDKYINVITSQNKKITSMVLKQFIYNIKLKLKKVHPKFILMPVFVGKQGVGKSIAIRKLLEPISHLSSPTDFAVFKDERKFKSLFGEKLVLEFDEMSAARKADIEAVKNKITADRVNYRPFHTQQSVNMFNMSSMIGSSNNSLIDLLYDDTGKRRFYEVACKMDNFWSEIEKIDALKLWQSVDIEQDPPIFPYLDELTEIQMGYTNLNSVEEFITDEGLIPEEDDNTFLMKRDELYKQYSDFMSIQKRHPYTRNKFYDRCRKLLKEVKGNSRVCSFRIKVDE